MPRRTREAAAAPPVILASASAARAALLRRAGVSFSVEVPAIDEAEVKRSLAAERAPADAAAVTLAELKASRVSSGCPGGLVSGADQILECGGAWFDKPADLAAARRDLLALRDPRDAQASRRAPRLTG